MSFSQMIQRAWKNKSPYLIFLRPFSWLYRLGFLINRFLYRVNIKKIYYAPVPIMVIGNITVGGSGKTPLLIALIRYLQLQHLNIAVISRGYGGQAKTATFVDKHSSPHWVGDEPCLIVQATGVKMAVSANRQQAVELLLQHDPDIDLILSDDGLQHWALHRDIEWIVLDAKRGLGNEKLLPEGYLREPVSRLQGATVIEHHEQSNAVFNMHLQVAEPYLLYPFKLSPQKLPTFDKNQTFHAVVGIGYPERFYDTLTQMGLNFHQHAFDDHYDYQLSDIAFQDHLPIITTEKDAVKLRAVLQNSAFISHIPPIWVVPVHAKLSDSCYQQLRQQLAECGIDYSQNTSPDGEIFHFIYTEQLS